MIISQLAQYFQKLENTTSRIKITEILAEIFKKANSSEIGKICYLALGQLLPAYKGVEFNLAEKMMIKVLAEATGQSEEKVRKIYKEEGDLGDTIYKLKSQSSKLKTTTKDLKLSVSDVYNALLEVARESGEGSQDRKIKKMADILRHLDALSAKFVARIPVGRLRLGFSEVTILDALSLMELGDKSARAEIERAFNVVADIGFIATQIKKYGIKSLTKIKAEPGIPIRPSLADRISGAQEAVKKVGQQVAVEPKLDGFRIQIHVWQEKKEKQVALFSRNLENTTYMFPEIVEAAKELKVKSVILDGEAIGYDPKTGKFAAFQETVQRKRKYGIEEMAKKIPLTVFVFDILYLNGKSLLALSFAERRSILEKIIKEQNKVIRLARQIVTDDPKIVENELKKAIIANLEGLVIKDLKQAYQAGSRGFHWVKLKPSSAAVEKLRAGLQIETKGLPDTIDCVIMGAWRGRGKRAKFGVGGFLLGVREGEKYYTISRLGTGLSDEQFQEAADRISKLQTKNKPKQYVVIEEEEPDIWIAPSLVVEILADEITLSPRHTAGRIKDHGYSLRFPRLVRFRDDKNPEDITTVKEIEKMYKMQK